MRIIGIVVLLLLVGGLGYYFYGRTAPTQDAAAVPDKPRVIRFASEGAYPPFNYLDTDGQLKGFDIEIAKAVCERAGITCTFSPQDWDGIIPGLLARKYDAIAASMAITPERAKVVAFTKPYYKTPIRFIIARDSKLVISPEGLQGLKIGVQRATTSHDYVSKNYAKFSKIVLYDTQDGAYLDLAAGRVQAVVADAIQAMGWLNSSGGEMADFAGNPLYVDQGIALVTRKGDEELLNKLNIGLEAIVTDGTYEKIRERYFAFDIYNGQF
jgi:putative lysine/arginine/ornithine/histidine/octopine transport system substrate-binding protein